MKKLSLLVIFTFVNFLIVMSQTNISFTIDSSGQDAAIDDYVTSNSHPNEIEYNTCAWTISGTPVIWRNVFKFDLSCIPPNAIIQTAELNLFYADTNSYSNTTHSSLTSSNESVLQRITSNWTENTVNWLNQPASTNIDEVILPQSTSPTQDYLNIDVKNIVQHMVNNPNDNFGFLLKLINESYYARLIFASGDNPIGSKHPKLNIKYSIPVSDCILFRLDQTGEDVAIDDYGPGNNYPNEIEYNTCAWTISGTPVIWRNLFKFNLPCELAQATIQSAHLSLYYAAQNNYGNTTHSSLTSSNESVLQRVTNSWSENSATWITQPTVTTVDEVILPQSISGTQDYTNIDVTNMVRQMINNNNQNYGFSLKLTNENYYARLIFASGDNPDQGKHPLLEVCYTIATSVQETDVPFTISVFPNPFKDEVNISIATKIANAQFNLYDALGKVVYTKSNLYGNQFHFDCPKIASGMYFYNLIESGIEISKGKLMKN